MTNQQRNYRLGKTLWAIANQLRGAMNADDFRDYMLSLLFLRYLSDNYEVAAKKELKADYPVPGQDDKRASLSLWYDNNKQQVLPEDGYFLLWREFPPNFPGHIVLYELVLTQIEEKSNSD